MKSTIDKVVREGKYGSPVVSYKMVYDSPQNSLEPIYYWFLDFLNGLFGSTEKIVDNFMSSPGSGHFADMNQRLSKVQEEGMKILGGLNQVIKSALNLVYDLREFKQRLQHYVDAKSESTYLQNAAVLALKNVWLDSVDMPKRGVGSIHRMTAELGYTTLRDAFMVAGSLSELENMEKAGSFNFQVGRILRPRLKEFLDWQEMSYKELTKRYSIEKNYLKNQIETIKLYSSWVKPYFQTAKELQQKGFQGNSALVNAFSTTMFQLTLFAKKKISLPEKLIKYKKKVGRDYYSCVLIDFKHRAQLLQRATQKGDYASAFGGRLEVTFDAYALNSEELDLIKKTMEKEDLDEILTFNYSMADDALKELKEDLDEFLEDKVIKENEENKAKEKRKVDDIDPFSALFSGIGSLIKGGNKSKTTQEKKIIETPEDIVKDNWAEKHMRTDANNTAGSLLYTTYDIYKKSHGMASSPTGFETGNKGEDVAATIKEVLKDGKKLK